MMSSNIGLKYYKTYFEDLCFELNGKVSKDGFSNEVLFQTSLNNAGVNLAEFNTLQNKKIDDIVTCYPGLLIGAGYAHEIGGKEIEDELKLGFFFDYTTGLPCIPGSSVKGVLRSACEADKGNYIKSILEELASEKRFSNVAGKAAYVVSKPEKIVVQKGQKFSEFISKTFEGSGIEPYKREVFFDAFPIASSNEGGKFLDNDFITHHESPIKDPNPVQFMKILPGVTFQFNFRLNDIIVDADLKLELFRQILLDIGIGAKTNVGYGQFAVRNNNEGLKGLKASNQEFTKKSQLESRLQSNWDIPQKAIPFLKKDKQFEGIITEKDGDYFLIEFMVNDQKCFIKKKSSEKVMLEINKEVRLICANDYLPNNPNISVKNK